VEDREYADKFDVPYELSEDDPGFWFQYGDENSCHNAMLGAPLPPGLTVGANAAVSKANLTAW
jgi:hypothetical protein